MRVIFVIIGLIFLFCLIMAAINAWRQEWAPAAFFMAAAVLLDRQGESFAKRMGWWRS